MRLKESESKNSPDDNPGYFLDAASDPQKKFV